MSIHKESPSSEPSGSQVESQSAPAKKRRTPGACDHCKKKKIRCDSAEMLGNRCSNCIQFSLECTHKEVSKTLGSAKGYVESLETRLEKMEKLLTKLLPHVDIAQELDKLNDADTPTEFPLIPRNDDDLRVEELVGKLRHLHVDPPQGRFFGKSSGYQLVQTALDIRGQVVGEKSRITLSSEPTYTPSWHPSRFDTPKPPSYVFPDDDLIPSLVNAYFEEVNPFFPLLHQPSFQNSISEGLHHRDVSFGGSLLLVCALGSRYSEDPRVLYPGTTTPHSAGWRWLEQVCVVRKSFEEPPSLGELQNHALYIMFSQSTETAQGCWTQLGMAIRMAMEVGAHRRRTLKAPTVEDESWKRVFWVLMALDRLVSSFSGRQCVLQEDDADVDRPTECDDEYWCSPDPTLAFKQPANKPSTVAFFNTYLKLTDIFAHAMRVIYSVKKPAPESGQSASAINQKIIMDLDSAMNSWMDSVPDHLRWNPAMKNKLFLKQSATLHATYYHLQILIHRPFIPSFRNPSPTTFPSLAICTNAARSCCHVLEVQTRSSLLLPTLLGTVFTSAIVLLVNIWSSKRYGLAQYPKREIDDVQRCFDIMKAHAPRWYNAGRFWELLLSLASAGDLPFKDEAARLHSFTTGTKRPRECDAIPKAQSGERPEDKAQRKMAGSQRVSLSPDHTPSPPSTQTLNYELPMYATELGRLPVYGQFNFSESCSESNKRLRRERPSPIRARAFSMPSHGEINAGSPFFSEMSSFTTQFGKPQCVPSDWDPHFSPRVSPVATPCYLDPGIHDNGASFTDNDFFAMWSTSATGFDLNEWGTYITSVDQLAHTPDTSENAWFQ